MNHVCPSCGAVFTSAGKRYAHQVLTREITVSPYEFARVQRASGDLVAMKALDRAGR